MTATGGQRRLSQIRDDFRDITECSVCRETFDDPRTLPCIHTFCRKCLEATASKPGNNKSPESQVLPCPLCRQEFDVPANGGVAGLQKNFFMVRLIDMTKQQHAAAASSVHPSVQLCDVCPPPAAEGNGDGDVGKAEQGVPSAVLFCRNCTLRLCDRCVLHHRRSRLTSAHDLVPPPSPADGKCYSSLRPDECEKHDGERLKLHCTDCQTVVCAFCFIEQHQGHRWSEVEKAADEFRRRIETNVADLAEHSSNLRSKRQELEGVKTDADLKLSDLEKRIHDRRALIVHVVGKHAMSLVAELGTKRQAKLKEIQLEQETIELQLANQASYADYCRELTAKGSAVDVCRAVKDLDSRSDDLQRMCRSLCRRTVEPVALKCNMPTIVGDFMKNKDKNFIGEIVKDEKATLNDGRPYNEAVKLQSVRITGIAVVGQELFIATEHTSTIKVYSLTTFEPIKDRRISVAGLTNPEDLTASQDPQRLYVFEASGCGKIYRVRSVDGLVDLSWITGDTRCRISVAGRQQHRAVSKVIVAYLTKGVVREYSVSTQARLEQQVPVKWPFINYAFKLADDSFLFTSGKLDSVGQTHCITNSKSKRKSEYGMKCPEQFIVDECGRVVLIDRGNRRILMLNSELEFLKEVISSTEGLVDPLRMAYDEERQRLLVTDFDTTNKTSRILAVRI